jgi:D-alanine--D-alanine ligase
MKRIKVAVLRGGPSSEYEISLKTGKSVLANLPDKYIPIDVFIDKAGAWHVDGVPVQPVKILQSVDVVFNALHGAYGEDGKLQQLLDQTKVKYTGSGALASALAMNKVMAKEIFKSAGIKTPVFTVIKKGEATHEIARKVFTTFPMPAIIKPNGSGSSVGVSLVKKLADILPAVDEALKYADVAIVEEFIDGKEGTCGVIEKFKGKEIYSLLPIEIRKPNTHDFFDYHAKYSGETQEICPGNFSAKESESIQKMAIEAHKALGLKSYSRSDFMVHPKRGVYILETNTLPGLTKESLLPKSLQAVGCTLPQFLDHVLTLAIEGR